MNFSLILMLLTVGTGIIWCLDRFLWRPKRLLRAKEEADRFSELNRQAIDQGEMSVIGEAQSIYQKLSAQPKWIEYTGGFFPVILFVFILRSFLAEPFRIPSDQCCRLCTRGTLFSSTSTSTVYASRSSILPLPKARLPSAVTLLSLNIRWIKTSTLSSA